MAAAILAPPDGETASAALIISLLIYSHHLSHSIPLAAHLQN